MYGANRINYKGDISPLKKGEKSTDDNFVCPEGVEWNRYNRVCQLRRSLTFSGTMQYSLCDPYIIFFVKQYPVFFDYEIMVVKRRLAFEEKRQQAFDAMTMKENIMYIIYSGISLQYI
jgi:hypothetical protein